MPLTDRVFLRPERVQVIRGLQGPGGIIPPMMEQALREAAKRRNANQKINRKWSLLNGLPGAALTPGDDGLIKAGDGFYREFTSGRIYYQSTIGVFWVYGSIGDKYTQLGGPSSWLGWPTSDEQPFTEDGCVSTFQDGAIYWWPDTGAIELGEISLRYT